jgi:hypothetical protein
LAGFEETFPIVGFLLQIGSPICKWCEVIFNFALSKSLYSFTTLKGWHFSNSYGCKLAKIICPWLYKSVLTYKSVSPIESSFILKNWPKNKFPKTN